MPVAFWGDPDGSRYRQAYFEANPGVWTHGDFIEIRPEGGVVIYGRSDTTLNPGGVRIGTAEIYRAVETMPEISDSIAVGRDVGGDIEVVLFVVPAPGVGLDAALIARIKERIRVETSPRHVPSRILAVGAVPYTISGKKGIDRLKGEGGWREINGCPLFTNDQIDLANQQMADVFTKNPKLNAFILVGGWAQFGPQAYAQVTDQVMAKLKSKQLIIIAGDTLPPQLDALKNGRSHAQIGQRPFEMGHRAPAVLIDLINGKKVADPLYTGLDECTPANLDKCPAK
jgi:hypothetical protein